jgi:hypothetical protein
MPERSDRHGWIDLLVPDGPFLSAAALDVQTVGENWPTRLSAEQRSLLTAPPASEAEEGEGWDDSSWDGRRVRVTELLTELLRYREGKTLAVAPGVAAHHHIYRARVSADFVIHAPDDPDDVRMVVICGPDATDDPSRLAPARTHTHDGWVSTPVQRAALLARHADADLALVTNGREHLLVNVVTGTTGSAMWTINGLEDRHARDAFVALLHKHRVLHRTVPLSKLIELSQDRQHELTDTLGKQIRRAAEALVNAISRANRTSRGRLLEGLTGQQVYAATTRVLMRTVFLLVAEERGLLPVAENQLFADQYAMSTLLDKLEEDAYRNRSAMERRAGAWQRMMALSRAVHAGIEHDDLRLPAYGGNLFDPDEHPFLEARVTAADGEGFEQLDVGVVDDFTVLAVLRHLQIADGQRISFRSLDVEQIGHVYEALLDHSAVIVEEGQVAVLGLVGKSGDEPEVPLVELEAWTAKSDKELGKQLADIGVAAEAKGIYKAIDDGLAPDSEVAQTLNVAVANDAVLRERVEPYAPLLRTDARGVALVFLPGDVYVTETSSKRDSGTAYTPRSLAEEIAKHTLDPLIYDPGPQNEPDETNWKLKPPDEILDLKICDPAVGSAAILVGAIRYLAEALVQARVEAHELAPEALASGAADVESVDARVQARRAIVSRCVYGVDHDPMAVEMAKLSLWLITMARDEPFTFLDHAIKNGDSLLGLTSLDELRRLHLDRDTDVFGLEGGGLFADQSVYEWRTVIDDAITEAINLRRRLRGLTVQDVSDALQQERLHHAAEVASARLRAVADAVVSTCLAAAEAKESETAMGLAKLSTLVGDLDGPSTGDALRSLSSSLAEAGNPNKGQPRPMFHWPLEFPEAFERRAGFDALLGNPPFLGGSRISGAWGDDYRAHLVRYVSRGDRGKVDLVAFFFRRAAELAAGMGFIATNSVYQGETRAVGPASLCRSGRIYRASSNSPWPGVASVQIAKIWWRRGAWAGSCYLDGRPVAVIESDLYPAGHLSGRPYRLPSRRKHLAGEGQYVHGDGFLLTRAEVDELVADDPRNAEVIDMYVGGSDVNNSPDHTSERWVINFRDWPLARAATYEGPFEIVRERARPQREKLKRKQYREIWWRFAEYRPSLIKAMEKRDWVIGLCRTSSRSVPVRLPVGPVYANKVIIIPVDDWEIMGLVTSTVQRVWADRYCSTLGTGLTYTPPSAYDPLPWPATSQALGEQAEALNEWRAGQMAERAEGITKLYGHYHSSESRDKTIDELRERQ